MIFLQLFAVSVTAFEMNEPSTISNDNFNWSEFLALFQGSFILALDSHEENVQAEFN